MKTNNLIILMGIIVLLFGACVGAPIVFDDTLPKEKTTTVNFTATGWDVRITEFNGINVDWNGKNLTKLVIPGGRTRFLFNGRITDTTRTPAGTTYRNYEYNNTPFVYNFENGKEYTMWVSTNYVYIFEGLPPMMTEKYVLHKYNMSNGQVLEN